MVEEDRRAETAGHGSVRNPAMPEVHICEVGPRDGLQNAKHMMPTAAKKAWIPALAAAGLKEIEVGSFVPPQLIPALADTGEIVAPCRQALTRSHFRCRPAARTASRTCA